MGMQNVTFTLLMILPKMFTVGRIRLILEADDIILKWQYAYDLMHSFIFTLFYKGKHCIMV